MWLKLRDREMLLLIYIGTHAWLFSGPAGSPICQFHFIGAVALDRYIRPVSLPTVQGGLRSGRIEKVEYCACAQGTCMLLSDNIYIYQHYILASFSVVSLLSPSHCCLALAPAPVEYCLVFFEPCFSEISLCMIDSERFCNNQAIQSQVWIIIAALIQRDSG